MCITIFPWIVNFISNIYIVKSKQTLSICKIWAGTGRRKSCFSSTALYSTAVANEEFCPTDVSFTSIVIKAWCSQILFQWKLHYPWAQSTRRRNHLSHRLPFHSFQPCLSCFMYPSTSTLHSFLSVGLQRYVKVKVNQSHYTTEVPRGIQEVKVPRLRDNSPEWW